MNAPFDPAAAAEILLTSLHLPGASEVVPLPGGRNNQVWRVESGARRFLLKRYFWSETDPRDRLGQEWAFLQYLREVQSLDAPEPLAKDPSSRCALLEFIDGTPVEISDVTTGDVHAAAEFFLRMNAQRATAGSLSPVSEACFSIESHLATVNDRVSRLSSIACDSETHEAAKKFIQSTILPFCTDLNRQIRSVAGSSLSSILPPEERCVSPSDFGFHNALRQQDGTLRFLDFEYAGWDDPAKTMIDFCNQPDRLLPDHLAAIFHEQTIPSFPSPESLRTRITLLEPLYQLKWACICLNGFLPGHSFTALNPDRSASAQLTRANVMALRAAVSFKPA